MKIDTSIYDEKLEIDGTHYAYKFDVPFAEVMNLQQAFMAIKEGEHIDEDASQALENAFDKCVDIPAEVRAKLPPVARMQIVIHWLNVQTNAPLVPSNTD